VEGELGRGWAESGAGQNSKRISFWISIDFRIWQNFGILYMEIKEEFDMRIFPKIF
jgi:hypothetical protein